MVGCVVSALALGVSLFLLLQLRRETNQLSIREALVAARDADTGTPLSPWFTYFYAPANPNFGFQISQAREDNKYEQRVLWVSSTALPITVGAEGYQGQTITIGGERNQDPRIIVHLKRKAP